MKIVNDCGSLYRLTEKRYRDYLAAGLEGAEPNAREYGTCIGAVAFTALDARPGDYAMAYESAFPGKDAPWRAALTKAVE